MPVDAFDNEDGKMAVPNETGVSPITDGRSMPGSSGSGGDSSGGGTAPGSVYPPVAGSGVPTVAQRLSQERREKVAGILSGTRTIPVEKDEPLIGPDGGMIGRGIKAAGDAYQDYVNGHRDGLMDVMKEKMTPPDWAVDAVATAGHSATETLTGIDTGYEPKYVGNKIFQVGTLFPKGVSGMLPRGFGVTSSLVAPVPALVQGVRWFGGDQIKPTEAVRAGASLVKSGAAISQGIGSPAALQSQEMIDKTVDAGIGTVKGAEGKF